MDDFVKVFHRDHYSVAAIPAEYVIKSVQIKPFTCDLHTFNSFSPPALEEYIVHRSLQKTSGVCDARTYNKIY